MIDRRRLLELMAAGGLCLRRGGATPSGPPLFTFGAIADAQFADVAPQGTRHYRASLTKLADAATELSRFRPAFTVHLGDFIDRDFASFGRALPTFRRLPEPRYHVLGNHDFAVKDEEKALVPKTLGLDRGWYDFARQGWRFLVLDGNAVSLHAHPNGTPLHREAESRLRKLKAAEAPNAMPWNGALGQEQLAWLEGKLAAAAAAEERVVLLCHFPLFPKNPHNLWDDDQVLRLLEAHPVVVAWINGHNHAGGYGVHAGVHCLTLPGMVETPDTTAYALVEVHDDALLVVGFGRTPGRDLGARRRGRT